MKPLKAFRRFEQIMDAEAGKRPAGKRSPGRPATGITKTRQSITVDTWILDQAKKTAFSERMSLSAWIEQRIEETLSPNGKGGPK